MNRFINCRRPLSRGRFDRIFFTFFVFFFLFFFYIFIFFLVISLKLHEIAHRVTESGSRESITLYDSGLIL